MLPLAKPTVNGGHETNVYFQPPSGVTLVYPCIVYGLDTITKANADNRAYLKNKVYKVTYIDTRPDSNIPDKLVDMPSSRMTAVYTSDGLYHYAYAITLY